MKITRILWSIIAVLFFIIFLISKNQEKILADGFYANCYMISLTDQEMKVFIDGETICISCPLKEKKEVKDKIVDIEVKKNRVVRVIWKDGLVEDKIESFHLTEGWINFSTYGKKYISSDSRLYIKSEDEVEILQTPGSLLNTEKVSCYIYNNEIGAVILDGRAETERIHVLLHGEIDGIFHEEVRLTATGNYKVILDEEETEYSAGTEVSFTKDMGLAKIVCPTGRIRILSMKRASGYPEYRGEITVYAYEDGFLMRNDLPLEEYLYSVVSSEMPANYPKEALKAQAVCARTYAVYQMEQAYYGRYGAHVDDTVNSQVYNNVGETAATVEAVQETKGQYLTYEKNPICAYFYSTSCGVTSDSGDVWQGGAGTPSYLKGKFQGNGTAKEASAQDYSDQETFEKFLKEAQPDCYEKEEPWFRWTSGISYEALTQHLQENAAKWLEEKPDYYRLEALAGEAEVGNIIKVQVLERSRGGVIKRLRITGEKGVLTILGEYQIRKALCPKDTEFILKDGSSRTCSMLPSGYFVIENKEELTLTGGGYGHGVGMSQNGAKVMAQQEADYEEILSFYYPETEILEGF